MCSIRHITQFAALIGWLTLIPVMGLSMPLARILSVEFVGNRELSQRRLRGWLDLNKGDYWNQTVLSNKVETLLERCRERGYYFARVDSVSHQWLPDSSRVRLLFHFHEGGRTRIASLEISSDDTLSENIPVHRMFHSHEGGIYKRDVFHRDLDELLRWYEDRGHPFCRVVPEQVAVEDGSEPRVNLKLSVEPGPLVLVDFILVEGNQRTRRKVIVREIRIPTGSMYRERDVERSVRRLQRLGYFRRVNPPEIVQNQAGQWGLHYLLAESPTYRFNGAVGYQPGTGDVEGYFSGLVDIVLANLMGTGRLAEAHWSRQGPGVQELAVLYQEPWVLGTPLTLGLGFRQRVEDTLYVQRSWDMGLQFPVTDVITLWGAVEREEVLPDSSGTVYLGLEKSSAWSLELGVTLDTRDEPMNPRSGYYYQSSGTAGLRDIEGDGKDALNEHSVSLDVEGVWEPFRFWVVDVQGHGREYRGPNEVVSLPNLYRLGGSTSLRGYREEQFLGQRIAWSNLEWRRILGQLSRAVIFLDAGYYYRQVESATGDLEELDGFKVGWGIGLRVETGIGVVGFDYGLGEGDRLTNGKVHFRLTNRF